MLVYITYRVILVPRPGPAFRHLQYGKVTESWAGPGKEAFKYRVTWEDMSTSLVSRLLSRKSGRVEDLIMCIVI